MVLAVALLAALFFPGIILRVKSLVSGRKGPGVLQPWRNIALLLRKGSVLSPTTSFVFRLAPPVYLATILCALLLLPLPGSAPLFGFRGDFVLFAYLLALGKFLFILGALDTGSSFEGMGANREALYSMLTEPVFFILFASFSLLTGNDSMQGIFDAFHFAGHNTVILGLMAVYLILQIALVENSRMPVDDPKTHLELTMIHEVMVLDYSGFDLALIQIGGALKFALYGILMANFLVPAEWPCAVSLAAVFGIQVTMASAIGLMESFRARKKLEKNPQFIVTLSAIALVAFVLVILITFKMIP